MCEPTTLAFATFALAAGTEIAKSEATKKHRNQGTEAANNAYEANINDLNARLREEQRSAAGVMDQAGIQTSQAEGTAKVSAAAAGVQGASIDLLLQDIEREEAVYNTSVRENLEATTGQIGRLKEQAAVQRDNQIAGLPSYNPFLGGLSIAKSMVQPSLSLYARSPTSSKKPTE